MSHRHLLTLLGLLLIAFGVFEGGWLLLLVWLGADFLVLGMAHANGAHRIFGKRQDGTLPLSSWMAFLPLLLYTSIVWHILRLISREPAHNLVNDSMVVGRRLLPGELPGEFANYVDLTAEFAEPPAIRAAAGYLSFPILDGSAPDSKVLREFVDRLRPGKIFIHCAQGHGRTGLFAVAVLLKSGAAATVSEGMQMLTKARSGIRLTAIQRRCVEQFAIELKTGFASERI
jgi:hypothetical protein